MSMLHSRSLRPTRLSVMLHVPLRKRLPALLQRPRLKRPPPPLLRLLPVRLPLPRMPLLLRPPPRLLRALPSLQRLAVTTQARVGRHLQ